MSFVVNHFSIMSKPAEYKAFMDCYDDFIQLVEQAPNDVCNQLIPLELLPPAVIKYVSNNVHDDDEKASRICNTLSSQIQINSEAVHLFINSLEKAGRWTRYAVENFQKALENRKQEECIESKQKITKPQHIQENCELWG